MKDLVGNPANSDGAQTNKQGDVTLPLDAHFTRRDFVGGTLVQVKIHSVYSYVNGNAGWDWADFEVLPLNPRTQPFTFAILFLWSRESGEWMCKGDFFVNRSLRTGKLEPPAAATK